VVAPIKIPARHFELNIKPTPGGKNTAKTIIKSVSRKEPTVIMRMQAETSALTLGGSGCFVSISSGYSLNWRLISFITLFETRLTPRIEQTVTLNGRQAPINTPTINIGSI